MPINYPAQELLHEDHFANFDNWYHEGVGALEDSPDGGMRLHCFGSKQGAEGCMAFFRQTLPDQVAVSYDINIRSQGGLVINYIAARGLNHEDLICDIDRLPERTGIMANYFDRKWGLQSYHVSFSRYNDEGEHTGTSNWRRNPGMLLVAHDNDPCCEVNRTYHIRVVKDYGHLLFFCDGIYAHGFIDRNVLQYPIPDYGKFGFRLIGSDVKADISNFKVHRVNVNQGVWTHQGLY